MSHWDYRVMQFSDGGLLWRAIHEVYYDDDDKPISYTDEPAVVMWDANDDNVLAPMLELQRMTQAIGKPTLTPADFGESV